MSPAAAAEVFAEGPTPLPREDGPVGGCLPRTTLSLAEPAATIVLTDGSPLELAFGGRGSKDLLPSVAIRLQGPASLQTGDVVRIIYREERGEAGCITRRVAEPIEVAPGRYVDVPLSKDPTALFHTVIQGYVVPHAAEFTGRLPATARPELSPDGASRPAVSDAEDMLEWTPDA